MTDLIATVRIPTRFAMTRAKTNPALLYFTVGIAAVIAAGVAVSADTLAQTAAAAGVALVLALAVGYLRSLLTATAPQRVRVRADGPLTFVPPAAMDRWPTILSLAALIPALVAATVDTSAFTRQGGVWLWILTAAALIWLAQQTRARRVPLGLAVSPAGLVGVRGAVAVNFPWEAVAGATVRSSGKDGALVLAIVGGADRSINASRLGSDPLVVAAVIEHFLSRPDERHLLASPLDALRRVESALGA